MRMLGVVAALGALCSAPAAGAQETLSSVPALTERTFAAVRDSIRLRPREAHWKAIPWRPDLGIAIHEAHERKLPILLWLMNGHPCGMT